MKELLTQFGVDWKLLIAQVINFALLLTVLRLFAYKPVIKMLDERRKKIAEGMAASEAAKKKLAETEAEEKEIILKANRQAFNLITEAEHKAHAQGDQIIEGARQKSEQVIAQGRKHLESEREMMAQEFEHEATDLIRSSLVKVIGKLEPAERDRTLIQEALRELKAVAK